MKQSLRAYYVRLIDVCLVIKMVLAVQRSCLVLISNVRFLNVDIDRMTRFMEGIGSGYIIIIIKEHFLKTIRTGLDKCIWQNLFFFSGG